MTALLPFKESGDWSLYIHIPFCQSKCRYCAFYSVPGNKQRMQDLVQALVQELETHRLPTPAKTIYIGGGSPSVLSIEDLTFLLERIQKHIDANTEFTMEINPAHAAGELLQALRRLGINRLSVGVQSFHQPELDWLGRIHRTEDIAASIHQAKQAGFQNISLDLIFAIPGSTLKDWKQSLRQAIDLETQHISVYSLSYEPGTPLYEDLKTGRIKPVDEALDRDMYETAIDMLEAAGYEQIEISNFARPGFACEHNVRCWKNRPYIGIGPAAASWHSGRRNENIADLHQYIEQIKQGQSPVIESHEPTLEQIACETAVLNLRMREGINRQEYLRQIGKEASELFAQAVMKNEKLGLLETTPGRIRLRRKALAIADSVLADFASIE